MSALVAVFVSPVKLTLLLLTLHLISDFLLQGGFSSVKRASFWRKACDGSEWASFSAMFRKYGNDYRAGIVCHAALWATVTFSPLLFAPACPDWAVLGIWIPNAVLHGWIDNLHVNHPMRINMIQDQLAHLAQVVATVVAWLLLAV